MTSVTASNETRIFHFPIVNKCKAAIRISGLNPDKLDPLLCTALCTNALVSPLFSAILFTACAGHDHIFATTLTSCIGAGIEMAPLLFILRVASDYRKKQSLQLEEPSEKPKFIVDNLHKTIIASQAINCVLGSIAGGFIITNQCNVNNDLTNSFSIDGLQLGIFLIMGHTFYLGMTVFNGGSKNF